MTDFLGVAFGVVESKLCAIATSTGQAVADLAGLSSADALAFLWAVAQLRQGRVMVGFEVAADIELAFRDFTPTQKDVLYGIIQHKENALPKDNPIRDWQVALKPGIVETASGYRVSMIPGKLLRLARLKQGGSTLYDVASFFEGCDLSEAVAEYAPGSALPCVEKNLLPLWTAGLIEQMIERCEAEAVAVAGLAAGVDRALEPLELGMRQWYGPSAVAGRCLAKWQARKQAKRLSEKNSVSELLKAIDCAYFGGRVEAVKLGTIPDVRTFDLNSAYAYATTFLSQFYSPLRFTRQYEPSAPFACWLLEYELPGSATLGVLPARGLRGGISYRSRGRGYFWQPEADYIMQRYPGCAGVRWGYVAKDYKPVTFAGDIAAMYEYRQALKNAGDRHEKVVKLSLSNLYGKFAQNSGTAYYQCRAWAGWITSFVRRLLLEAVTGCEAQVICFAQDAVHMAGCDANIDDASVSDALGHYKRREYAQGFYVAPGIYQLCDALDITNPVDVNNKSATRGANLELDFERIAADLSSQGVTELTREFFVGWQLLRKAPLRYHASYLDQVAEALEVIPANIKARSYQLEGLDWKTEQRDSGINRRWSGLLSARYLPQDSPPAVQHRIKDRGWV